MGLGVPKLRALFLEAFGHHTASNNGAWLRRKLCEAPDAQRGRGRSAAVRKRDQGAAIWTTGTVRNITQARCMPGCTLYRIPAHSLLCWQCADAWLAWPVESSVIICHSAACLLACFDAIPHGYEEHSCCITAQSPGPCGCQLCGACMRARCLQAEAKVLVANGPMLANGSFIAIPEASGGANDAGSVANSPHDTPSITPTKHIQHKVFSVLSF